jgi:hypothetical protein
VPTTMRMRRPTPEEVFGGVHVGAALAGADGEAGTASGEGGGNAPSALVVGFTRSLLRRW